MALSPLLPSRLRVGLLSLRQNIALLRSTRLQEQPVVRARHTRSELEALNRKAAEDRCQILEDARAQAAARDSRTLVRSLTLLERIEETPSAVSLVFEIPEGEGFAYTPGQYMTLLFEHEGREHRRCYSFSSDPAEPGRFTLTVKRVEGGRISNHIHDALQPGALVRAQGPNGRFGTSPKPDERRRVILVGGGSGITPLMSIAQSLSEREPFSQVELFYGNRSAAEIIFRDRLAALSKRRPNFKVRHILEALPEGPFGGLACRHGRLSGAILEEELPVDAGAEYFICGPGPMMDGVIAHLKARGIPGDRIHAERFASPAESFGGGIGATYSVQLARSGALFEVADDATLLDGGLAAGLPMAFSCAMGGCAACKVRVVEGEVEMDEPNCLTPEERARGEVLACVARPRSPLVLDL